jgi:hypothetical protein
MHCNPSRTQRAQAGRSLVHLSFFVPARKSHEPNYIDLSIAGKCSRTTFVASSTLFGIGRALGGWRFPLA